MNFEDTFIGRPNTVRAYKSLFKTHIAPLGDTATVEEALAAWKVKGLSVRTRQILLRLLKNYTKHIGGPTLEIKRLHSLLSRETQQEELTVLNPDQAKELVETCKRLEPKFLPILLLGLHGGLRRGEIFGLRCGDIDMFKGKIRVAHSYDGPTKNGKTRYVPMSKDLLDAMTVARNLLMRHPEERVFEILDPNPVLRRLCYAIKVEPMRFHDCRHTFATMALEGGISPKQVANWLGHSSVVTTLGIYWNLSKDEADLSFLPGGNQ
jgi:integrase